MPTKEQVQKMEAAAPDKAPAKPAKPRKLLVWGHLYTHEPNPFAAKALEVLGKKSGAFEAVVSEEPNDLLPERLKDYDAIVMNNIHEPNPFLPADLAKLPAQQQEAARKRDQAIKKSVLAFVTGGKGVVGIHAATAACQGWKEYGEMIGGYYATHIAGQVAVKLDEPQHPLNACFQGKGFKISDEIYIFRQPYSRKDLRVLLSLDVDQMTDPAKRPDKDYAISWVRPYGQGRVFYCSLGHASETYWNPLFLQHVLAGIQFALGDLKADAAPSGK
jgi:type 1 glutamine amidotransferase